ncbi:MAG: hypothetical protein JNK49_13635 [Planctomycetes bacterium]|nr:hypothetical protein [Planctomycetota bacterium]
MTSLLVGIAAAQEPSAPPTADDAALLAATRKAVAWIERQAKPVEGAKDAVQFPGSAEAEEAPTPIVYGGSAGVLLFLENAAKVLDDTRARALADKAAAGLLAVASKDAHGITWAGAQREEGSAALYVGDAGVGAAFLARAKLRGDAEALATATNVGNSLLARAVTEGEALHWDKQVEIIYGTAGTALFLLDLAAACDDAAAAARFRNGAKAAGRHLIAESAVHEAKPAQRSWRWQLANNKSYTGFSHGTAGVAYALLRIGLECQDAACVQAAKDGAEWVLALAMSKDGAMCFPVASKSTVSLGGWCHGAPGTARLFLLLHAATQEARWLEAAIASAKWVVAQAGPADAAIPPAFPPSYCCGVAGALEFFVDLQRATGDVQYGAFARRAAAYLLQKAEVDGDGLKWANGANGHQAGKDRHNVDLMLGAAGEAFALLRLATLATNPDPMVGLPDRRVAPRAMK